MLVIQVRKQYKQRLHLIKNQTFERIYDIAIHWYSYFFYIRYVSHTHSESQRVWYFYESYDFLWSPLSLIVSEAKADPWLASPNSSSQITSGIVCLWFGLTFLDGTLVVLEYPVYTGISRLTLKNFRVNSFSFISTMEFKNCYKIFIRS